jgi:hypothetical protein
MKAKTEAKIQQECLMWFQNNIGRYKNGIMFSVPNESSTSQQRMVNLGLLKGVSDTIIILQGKVLFVEFKAEKGTQSEFQKEFQNKVELLGFKYFIIRNLDEFKNIIE